MKPVPTNVHEPAWLVAAADQRVAHLKFATGGKLLNLQLSIVMTTLTEPEDAATPEEFAKWDWMCDHCGMLTEDLICGHVNRALEKVPVCITFGACPSCMALT